MSGPRLVFYGDDFTGSTDALEVLAFAGLRTALFLRPPTSEMLARFQALDAFGVAGDSRGMSVAEMDREMPAILAALRDSGADIVHYKTCSTFDSSPETGSIGRVMTIAREIFRNRYIPVVGATPALARYCLFGNLFARSGTDGEVYRIDRHPVMSVHPVTPMAEGDLGQHLALQADLRIGSCSYLALESGDAAVDARLLALAGHDAILFDSGSASHLDAVGRVLVCEAGRTRPLFVVGGSGVEYALIPCWGAEERQHATDCFEAVLPVDRILAGSGSASRVTAMQIDAAVRAGFIEMPVDTAALLEGHADGAAEALVTGASRLLAEGRSVVIHIARGPDDPRLRVPIGGLGARATAGRRLGQALGSVIAGILARVSVSRVVVAGGDTSSQVVQVLAPDALEIAARLAPGVPLCRMHAQGRGIDGTEIALKGGQMGGEGFFEQARSGAGLPRAH